MYYAVWVMVNNNAICTVSSSRKATAKSSASKNIFGGKYKVDGKKD
jgi:hypothetical protein